MKKTTFFLQDLQLSSNVEGSRPPDSSFEDLIQVFIGGLEIKTGEYFLSFSEIRMLIVEGIHAILSRSASF